MSFLLFFGLLVPFATASAIVPVFFHRRLRRDGRAGLIRLLVAILPAACVAASFGAADRVVDGAGFTLGVPARLAVALVEYLLFMYLTRYLGGIHVRDDVIERDNRAAAIALAAAAVALLPSVAGYQAYLAEPRPTSGPAFWLVSPVMLTAAWLLLERFTRISWAITIDRDIGAALRLGAFLLAAAGLPAYLVLSRLLRSQAPTPSPWAAIVAPLPVLLLALFLERNARTPSYPLVPARSLAACAGYVALGAAGAVAASMILR